MVTVPPNNHLPPIDWGALVNAMEYYHQKGYQKIDVPWIVSPESLRITYPERDEEFAKNNGGYETCYGDLVGSAEQSFLDMQFKDQLKPGRYVALTPCFRIEPEYDSYHFPYFAKTELYITDTPTYAHLVQIVEQALTYFKSIAQKKVEFEIETMESGYDIIANGIEIGSYNKLSHNGIDWLCATGLAEPRFSMICL